MKCRTLGATRARILKSARATEMLVTKSIRKICEQKTETKEKEAPLSLSYIAVADPGGDPGVQWNPPFGSNYEGFRRCLRVIGALAIVYVTLSLTFTYTRAYIVIIYTRARVISKLDLRARMGRTNEKWVWFTATRGYWNPLSKILHPPLHCVVFQVAFSLLLALLRALESSAVEKLRRIPLQYRRRIP